MLTQKNYFLIGGIILISIIAFLCLISNILFPFVISLIIAYFLHPAVTRLHRLGISRTLATFGIMSVFFISFGALLILLAPTLYNELEMLVTHIPEYFASAKQVVFPKLSNLLHHFSPDTLSQIMTGLSDFSTYFLSFMMNMTKNIWDSGVALINILSLIFITPVVTFYVLRDWKHILECIHTLFPPKYRPAIETQLQRIDETLSGYLRGQIHVCLCLSIFYVISLSLVGLDFALFVGITSGILAFIPYVGVFFGLITSLIIAFFQFGDSFHLLLVLAVFILAQILESMFITPKLVGDKVGLHPVWVIFGMLAGSSLFGFTGLLLAIPVSAVLGVLVRFSREQYLASPLFTTKKRTSKPDTAA